MKYGFVYIWYDRKRKMFYIGCHWGAEDDGYICSSKWMRDRYRLRPEDFKRRILSRIYTNRQDLLEEEHRWFQRIKPEELGKRYYNLKNHHYSHWSMDENTRKIVSEKLSKPKSEETKTKISIKLLGNIPWNKGKKGLLPRLSKDHKEKISQSNLGRIHSKETREKIRRSHLGKKHSEESKQKMSMNNVGHLGKNFSTEHKNNISESLKNFLYENPRILSEEHKRRIGKSLLGKKRGPYKVKTHCPKL